MVSVPPSRSFVSRTCRVDAYPWPCADAKLNLLAGFKDRTLALHLYLAAQFVEALTDLSAIDPDLGDPPDPRAIYERFMGWVPVVRKRPT
jgi:hypothetical protein